MPRASSTRAKMEGQSQEENVETVHEKFKFFNVFGKFCHITTDHEKLNLPVWKISCCVQLILCDGWPLFVTTCCDTDLQEEIQGSGLRLLMFC